MTGSPHRPEPSTTNFIAACYGRPVQRRPIWIMRQAGRYQASYRAVRERHSFEDVCRTPELAAQVTVQPVREFDFDAAIIFSDILVIFPPMGLPVHFDDGGPKIAAPIRRPEQVDELSPLDPTAGVGYVMEAIRQTRQSLSRSVALIGFSGAPFTLACYAIEGTTSREFAVARRFFHAEPQAAERLMERLSGSVADYLAAQIDAGAQAVQIFDSWGGVLSADDYRRWVLPHVQSVVQRIRRPGIPIILYVNGSAHLLSVLNESGCDVISVDWRTDLHAAAEACTHATAIQGNLDPLALSASSDTIRERATAIMARMDLTPKGHIFNLDHGIMPETSEEHVRVLIQTVHATPPKK